jgi:hypothetical protein
MFGFIQQNNYVRYTLLFLTISWIFVFYRSNEDASIIFTVFIRKLVKVRLAVYTSALIPFVIQTGRRHPLSWHTCHIGLNRWQLPDNSFLVDSPAKREKFKIVLYKIEINTERTDRTVLSISSGHFKLSQLTEMNPNPNSMQYYLLWELSMSSK